MDESEIGSDDDHFFFFFLIVKVRLPGCKHCWGVSLGNLGIIIIRFESLPSRGIKATFPGLITLATIESSREFILEKHSSNSCRSPRLEEIHRHRKNNRKLSSWCGAVRRWSGLATACLELWLKYVYSGTTLSTIEREQEALALILNCLSWPVTFLLPSIESPPILRTGWIKYDQE